MLTMRWDGTGARQLSEAMTKCRGRDMVKVLRRAVNHTGDATFTAVRRALAKQVGLSQGAVVSKGRMKKLRAGGGTLDYVIQSSGGYLTLRHFGARQGRKGVSAAPWGKRQLFDGTFTVAMYGGDVFKREGAGRGPLEILWGPSIPREMLRNESAQAFQSTVAARLAPRVEHEIRALTRGVVS